MKIRRLKKMMEDIQENYWACENPGLEKLKDFFQYKRHDGELRGKDRGKNCGKNQNGKNCTEICDEN